MSRFCLGKIMVVSILLLLAPAEAQTAPEGAANDAGDLRKTPDWEKDEIYLCESLLESFRVVTKIDLPNRAYLKKTKTAKEHQYFLSQPNGKLPNYFLLVGSVVRGDRIGNSRDKFYELTKDFSWQRSESPEKYYVQDDSAKGGHRIIIPAYESLALVAKSPQEAKAITRLESVGFEFSRDKEGATYAYIEPEAARDSPFPRDDLSLLAEISGLNDLRLDDSGLTDMDIGPLRSLTRLESLSLDSTKVTDLGLRELKPLKNLKTLSLDFTKTTDAGLNELRPLERLVTLSLTGTDIMGASFKDTRLLPRLKELLLDYTKMTDEGMTSLRNRQELEVLDLSRTQITNAGLKEVGELRNLRELKLSCTSIDDLGIHHLRGLARLEVLSLSADRKETTKGRRLVPVITNAALKDIGQLKSLRELILFRAQITDAGLNDLAAIPNLEFLDLKGTNITDVGLLAITKLTNLSRLNLDGTDVTDAGLEIIERLPNLKELSLKSFFWEQKMRVTEAGIKKLKKARPNLVVFSK